MSARRVGLARIAEAFRAHPGHAGRLRGFDSVAHLQRTRGALIARKHSAAAARELGGRRAPAEPSSPIHVGQVATARLQAVLG